MLMGQTNISLDQNAQRLVRYAFLEQAAMRTLAGWLPGVPEWDVKNELGLHIWEDADSAERLRGRLRELRVHRPERDFPEGLVQLGHELDYAGGTRSCWRRSIWWSSGPCWRSIGDTPT